MFFHHAKPDASVRPFEIASAMPSPSDKPSINALLTRRVLSWIAGHPWQSLFALGVSLLAWSTVSGIIGSFTLAPLWDEWAEVLWLKRFYAAQGHISDLWRQHNEHRILLPRLFVLTDYFVFRGTRAFVLICILLLQAVHARIFIRATRPFLTPELRLFYAGSVIVFLFSAAQMENFIMTFQTQVVLVFLLATTSIAALLHSLEAARAGKERAALIWFGMALAGAVGGTYSLASGILIWPTLLLLALCLRLRARWVLALAVTAALVSILYFRGYHTIAGHPLALGQPMRILFFTAGMVSLPLARIQHELGIAFGLLELAFAGWLAIRLILDRERLPRTIALFSGVMIFIVASSFATAVGRAVMGVPEAANNNRYTTWAGMFWTCLIGVLLIDKRLPYREHPAKNAVVITGVIAFIFTAILPAHLNGRARFMEIGALSRESSLALIANVCDADLIRPVFPDPSFSCEAADFLRAHRLSMFAPEFARQVGTRLRDRYRVIQDKKACAGVYESHNAVASPDRPGSRVTGWAWDTARNRPPQRIVLTDAGGTIRGFAQFSRARPDLAASYRNAGLARAGWFGFVQGDAAAGPYNAYAVLADHSSACLMETLADRKTSLLGIFQNGQWLIDSNKNGLLDPPDLRFSFGLPGDLPVVADWDGTGRLKAGVFRKGQWHVDWNGNNQWDDRDQIFDFGAAGDLPVVGDWNHNGVTKIGVFRDGKWILDWNGNHRYDPEDRTIVFGLPGDLPVVGDWDGSGIQHIGVFRNGTWYLDMDGDFQLGAGDKILSFGLPGDQPAAGNWLGLGRFNLGVFRKGQFHLDWNGSGQWDEGDRVVFLGQPGDLPVVW